MSRLSFGHAVMIVAGLAAFLLVFSLLRNREETFQIATAAGDLRAGTTVTAASFAYAELGVADRNLLEALLDPEQVARAIEEGWVVTRRVQEGDPVRMSDFRTQADTSEVRAMSIPIERGHAVAGALQAGDLIDVIVVRKGVAEYVVTGAEVLDVDEGESQFGGGFSVTLAVDGPASLRVASALRDGGIELVRATGATGADPLDFFDPLQGSSPESPRGEPPTLESRPG